MELVLNTEEEALLVGILEHRHRELQREISHTHHREFKATLRRNEKLLESILTRLRSGAMEPVRG
jgi:hypothetical protein